MEPNPTVCRDDEGVVLSQSNPLSLSLEPNPTVCSDDEGVVLSQSNSLSLSLSLSLWNQTPQCAVMMKVLFSLKETNVAFLFKGVPSLSPFLIHSLIHSRAHSLAAHYGATKGP